MEHLVAFPHQFDAADSFRNRTVDAPATANRLLNLFSGRNAPSDEHTPAQQDSSGPMFAPPLWGTSSLWSAAICALNDSPSSSRLRVGTVHKQSASTCVPASAIPDLQGSTTVFEAAPSTSRTNTRESSTLGRCQCGAELRRISGGAGGDTQSACTRCAAHTQASSSLISPNRFTGMCSRRAAISGGGAGCSGGAGDGSSSGGGSGRMSGPHCPHHQSLYQQQHGEALEETAEAAALAGAPFATRRTTGHPPDRTDSHQGAEARLAAWAHKEKME